MDYVNQTVAEFSEALSSKAPVPGGGGVSALVASLAAGLGLMVGNLTLGKKKYEANETELKTLMDETEGLRRRLLALIDEDAVAFAPLAAAYSIPKDAEGRDEIMESCLEVAAAVPLEILELSCRVIELQREYKRLGSALAVSDAGTGAVLAWGAMYAAALNVLVNTKAMKNREKRDAMNARVRELMDKYWVIADKVYEAVYTDLLPV